MFISTIAWVTIGVYYSCNKLFVESQPKHRNPNVTHHAFLEAMLTCRAQLFICSRLFCAINWIFNWAFYKIEECMGLWFDKQFFNESNTSLWFTYEFSIIPNVLVWNSIFRQLLYTHLLMFRYFKVALFVCNVFSIYWLYLPFWMYADSEKSAHSQCIFVV